MHKLLTWKQVLQTKLSPEQFLLLVQLTITSDEKYLFLLIFYLHVSLNFTNMYNFYLEQKNN